MTFGEKLLELRRKGAMSQDVLAERLGVSRQAVSKWERDEAVPETDKVIRIAQIFGVTTDYLLLDDEQSQPDYSRQTQHQAPPRYSYTGSQTGRAERFIRSHGYKFGYILIAIGTLICLMSLGMRLLWPVIANGFFGGFMGSGSGLFDDFGAFGGSSGMILDENGNVVGSIDDLFGNANSAGSIFDGFGQSASQRLNKAVQAQANIFLIGLLPGFFLIAAGLFVVIKDKKMAQETLES